MNKTALAILLFPLLILNQTVKAQEVDAYFYYSPFYAPGTGVYIETYLAITGNTMRYRLNNDNVYQATAEVTMLFKNADEIVEFRTFKVTSPGLPDTTSEFPTFIDQHRIIIPDGVYNFEMIVKDVNSPDSIKPFKYSDLVTVHIPHDHISLSGVELVEKYEATEKQNIFVKNGFECVPYVSDVFPQKVTYLKFYAEIYNAAKSLGPLDDFTVQFHIEKSNTGKPIKEFNSFQKQKAQNMNVVYKEINISKLPTGFYYLIIEIKDRENKLVLETRKFFQRLSNFEAVLSNETMAFDIQNTFVAPITNRDTLVYYINSLYPVCDLTESRFIDNQLQTANLKMLQQFFFNFWKSRNETNPEMGWHEYHEKLKVVDQQYSFIQKHGFESDRGRVYLQYGPPSSVIKENNEANAYPYEIWLYFKVGDQTNKKFIFYNKTLLNNDYKLLNSNMKGEINNPLWENELYSRSGYYFKTNKSKALEIFEEK